MLLVFIYFGPSAIKHCCCCSFLLVLVSDIRGNPTTPGPPCLEDPVFSLQGDAGASLSSSPCPWPCWSGAACQRLTRTAVQCHIGLSGAWSFLGFCRWNFCIWVGPLPPFRQYSKVSIFFCLDQFSYPDSFGCLLLCSGHWCLRHFWNVGK